LPGIGPVKAQAIIDHREKDGAFLTKEQIMNVSGIGQATYNKLEGYICVD
ncbi:MAG: helix-hairpin-helix domain-containing protein, partial [Firmicutes bacterium]|nr:helix-hairpin-helix domain-containing protein [Bacillota bacterium]